MRATVDRRPSGRLQAAAALVAALCLALAPPAGDDVITGRLHDADDQPLPDIVVRYVLSDDDLFDDLYWDRGIELQWAHGDFIEHLPATLSGEDGAFRIQRFTSLYGDSHYLYFSGPGVASRFLPVTAETGPLDLTLAPGITITGRVVDDLGRPQADAHACVWIEWFDDVELDNEQVEFFSQTFCAQADAQGRFQLVGLAPGSVHVIVSRPLGDEVTVEDVALTAGEDVELGDVVLDSGATLAGQVVDDEGQPVPGARVLFVNPEHADIEAIADGAPWGLDTWADTRTVLADDDGRFSISGVTTETIGVVAHASGYLPRAEPDVELDEPIEIRIPKAPPLRVRVRDAQTGELVAEARVAATRHPGRTEEDEWLLAVLAGADITHRLPDVELSTGDRLVIGASEDGTLIEVSAPGYGRRRLNWPGGPPWSPGPLDVGLEPESLLTGRVTDLSGRRLKDVELSLNLQDSGVPSTWRRPTVTTDERGAYRFDGLSAGTWRVGWRWFDRPHPSITLAAGEEAEFDLEAPIGTGAISGFVSMASGTPLAGFDVRLAWADLSSRSTYSLARTKTAEDGRYEFSGLGPGEYLVSLAIPGRRHVALESDEHLHADIVLSRPFVGVRGRLVKDGVAVPGELRLEDAYSFRGRGLDSPARDGRFFVYGLTDDEERATPLLLTGETRDRSARGDVLVMVPPDTILERDIELRSLSTGLTGRLVEDTTGAPIAKHRIRLSSYSGRISSISTDDDGRFGIDSIVPGPLFLRVERGAYRGVWPVQVDIGSDNDFTLRLPTLSSVSGTVALPTAWPAERTVRIEAQPLDDQTAIGGSVRYQAVVQRGHFVFEALPVGRYRILPPAWSASRELVVGLPDELTAEHPVIQLGDVPPPPLDLLVPVVD